MIKRVKKVAALIVFGGFMLGATTATAQTPQLPQQQQQQQQIDVSDAELAKFANAFQGVRMINMEAQQEMTKVVQEEGMDIERFNQIHQATLNPEVEVDATKEEKEKHQKVIVQLEGLQTSFQERMDEVIQEQDLSPQRFEQIAMVLQQDPELQERLRKHFEQ